MQFRDHLEGLGRLQHVIAGSPSLFPESSTSQCDREVRGGYEIPNYVGIARSPLFKSQLMFNRTSTLRLTNMDVSQRVRHLEHNFELQQFQRGA